MACWSDRVIGHFPFRVLSNLYTNPAVPVCRFAFGELHDIWYLALSTRTRPLRLIFYLGGRKRKKIK